MHIDFWLEDFSATAGACAVWFSRRWLHPLGNGWCSTFTAAQREGRGEARCVTQQRSGAAQQTDAHGWDDDDCSERWMAAHRAMATGWGRCRALSLSDRRRERRGGRRMGWATREKGWWAEGISVWLNKKAFEFIYYFIWILDLKSRSNSRRFEKS
jgi:hypothetical protein